MNLSFPTISKIVKQEENNYVFFGEKISIRACSQSCEYLTVFQDNEFCGENYKLGLSNLGSFEHFDSIYKRSGFGEKFKFYQNLFSSSEFYLLKLDHLLINSCNEKEHIQYGDKFFISSFIHDEMFIVGFEQTSGKFILTKFEEISKSLNNNNESNDFLIKKYQWSLDKIAISKDESIIEGNSNLPIPNSQSVKYNEIFTIKFNDEHFVSTNTISSNLNMQFSQLSLDNTSISGRGSYWTIIPLKIEGTVYPNWFLMKGILKNKKNNTLKFLDNKIIEKLIKNQSNYSKIKIEPIRLDTFELVLNRPIGWDTPSINFSENKLKLNTSNKFLSKSIISLPSITGFVFDHAEIGINNTVRHNIIPNKLSSFSVKIQEQLILEDILNCLICNNGNYIKVTEQIVEFFHNCEHLDFISEDLYIFEINSTCNDKYLNLYLIPGREGISAFSHKIFDDPNNLKYIYKDMVSNKILEEPKSENILDNSFEMKNILPANIFKKNPSLYPLSYETLELSSLHRRIRKFLKVHESGNSQFGIISNTLCDSFRELLKHFMMKITKFESYLRKGQLTVQNLYAYSQQALVTLKALDLISTQVLHKKGCEIIDQIYKIANNEFKGEESSQKIANFIFNQVFISWFKHFLTPWLKLGTVLDHFSEFINCNLTATKRKFNTENIQSNNFYKEKEKIYFIIPSFMHELIDKVNYIGLVSHFVSHVNHLHSQNQSFDIVKENGMLHCKKLENTLEQILHSLSNKSDLIRNEEVKLHINAMFFESQQLIYNACNSISDVRYWINKFYEIFFCANDSLIQEFIEHIHKLGFRGEIADYNSSNNITRKWSELMVKYYGLLNDSDKYNRFVCKIEKNLITELVTEELFNPTKWEIKSVLFEEDFKFIQKNKQNISCSDAFKYLTIKFHEIKTFGLIWPRELLYKYEVIFRLVFHLKYINYLLNNIWKVHQTSNDWDCETNKKKSNISISGLIFKSYSLRQKMLLLITGILEYIYQDIIIPIWGKMMQNLNNISTLEELNFYQDRLLNEILTLCFFSEGELINSLYMILSLCHLFASHSNLLNIYGFCELEKKISSKITGMKNGKHGENVDISTYSRNLCKNGEFENSNSIICTNGHIKDLLIDTTYINLVEKFSSKFELLLSRFFSNISNCKSKNVNLINKLLLKLNFNGFYIGRIPASVETWGEYTLNKNSSLDDLIDESG
ncbi:Spc97 / Spc98 family protein [Cryptosporidium meleagridis]|uniref:Spc97 / Spc98 family protein n=1 Tax=Cryptosporidium meleagridis TaxID=93969 RepID=A0A2P4YY38_9CRYT|nr:Spc97 / Spc98 family protein [Cryptosporidium meleagridis]